MKDLEETINRVPCEAVVIGTPIDLRRVVNIAKPSTRVEYVLDEISRPGLPELLDAFVRRKRVKALKRKA
jgi:predicted GTPase